MYGGESGGGMNAVWSAAVLDVPNTAGTAVCDCVWSTVVPTRTGNCEQFTDADDWCVVSSIPGAGVDNSTKTGIEAVDEDGTADIVK